MTLETRTAEHIDTTEQAKLIRQALKKAFPAIKFSARISRYAGGSSVDVQWTDGPTEDQVRAITDGYAGGGFDGMIDMAYSVQAWLLPDGSVRYAGSDGTGGSRGSVPASYGSPMHPDARLVRFSGDYVQTQRTISPEFQARCLDKVRETLGHPMELEDHVPDFWYRGHSYRYPNPSGHDCVAFVARRTATKGSDWVPEWKRPKPKGPKPVPYVRVNMTGTSSHGSLRGEVAAHSGRPRTRGKWLGFYFEPNTGRLSFYGGVAPNYVRKAIAEVLTWATGQEVKA